MPDAIDRRLARFARLVRTGRSEGAQSTLRLGVDLGTSNIVVAAVDAKDRPVAGGLRRSTVVRDGVVVDWHGAVEAVRALTSEIRKATGAAAFDGAAVAIPPGINKGTVKVFTNVLEAAGLETSEVVDEPVAAATALGLSDGAVIDIGAGTTGVSLLRGGEVQLSVDEATGGHHMTLVVSGALGLDYEAADEYKRNPKAQEQVFALVRPTLEKMATIAQRALAGQTIDEVHLVGGSSSFQRAPEVFADVLGMRVLRPKHPLYPTPLGTAMRRST